MIIRHDTYLRSKTYRFLLDSFLIAPGAFSRPARARSTTKAKDNIGGGLLPHRLARGMRFRRVRAREIHTGIGTRWPYIHACTRVRNHREAALYAGPFICEDKIQIGSTASARGPASICHGDATHRYRLARPRNYPRRARILQRTPVIYRAARRHVTPSTGPRSPRLLFPLSSLWFIFFPPVFRPVSRRPC